MLYQKDIDANLFIEIAKACCLTNYPNQDTNLSYFDLIKNGISEDKLFKVKSLNLSSSNGTRIKSLKGIERLVNLENLSIIGENYSSLYWEVKLVNEARKNHNLDLLQQINKLKNDYTCDQILDLTPIYKCRKLVSLKLDNQRGIKEIDFSTLPRLRQISLKDCTNLEEIKGIDKIKEFPSKEFYKDIMSSELDLTGCYNLSKIENFDKFILSILPYCNVINHPKIMLPATKFFTFISNNPKLYSLIELLTTSKKYSSPFLWKELYVSTGTSDLQLIILNKKINELITNNVKLRNYGNFKKIYAVYNWICKNFSYDKDGLKLSNDPKTDIKTPLSIDYKITQRLTNVSDIIRSSFMTFIRKQGVCCGISSLFNYMLAYLGYDTEPVLCSSELRDYNKTMVVSNHQISAVKINGKKYYFDPTHDIGE
jgi:hypothetical protein